MNLILDHLFKKIPCRNHLQKVECDKPNHNIILLLFIIILVQETHFTPYFTINLVKIERSTGFLKVYTLFLHTNAPELAIYRLWIYKTKWKTSIAQE